MKFFNRHEQSIEKFHIELYCISQSHLFWNIHLLDLTRKGLSCNYEHNNIVEHCVDLK